MAFFVISATVNQCSGTAVLQLYCTVHSKLCELAAALLQGPNILSRAKLCRR
jgi:hypothetical protein